jgi:DNA modification methylase
MRHPYYEHAGIAIYHGDCREILPTLPKCDLLLTDPPYGIFGNDSEGRHDAANGWAQYGVPVWDKEPADRATIELCRMAAKRSIIWGGNYFHLPPSMGWLIWNKMQRNFSLADAEMAWTSERKATRIFDYSRRAALQDGKSHPTQKPLALMKWCLSLFPDARTVLDPYCGSGTTLVAAKAMGLQATGIEIEERYCEIAAHRLSQEVFNFSMREEDAEFARAPQPWPAL